MNSEQPPASWSPGKYAADICATDPKLKLCTRDSIGSIIYLYGESRGDYTDEDEVDCWW